MHAWLFLEIVNTSGLMHSHRRRTGYLPVIHNPDRELHQRTCLEIIYIYIYNIIIIIIKYIILYKNY